MTVVGKLTLWHLRMASRVALHPVASCSLEMVASIRLVVSARKSLAACRIVPYPGVPKISVPKFPLQMQCTAE